MSVCKYCGKYYVRGSPYYYMHLLKVHGADQRGPLIINNTTNVTNVANVTNVTINYTPSINIIQQNMMISSETKEMLMGILNEARRNYRLGEGDRFRQELLDYAEANSSLPQGMLVARALSADVPESIMSDEEHGVLDAIDAITDDIDGEGDGGEGNGHEKMD